VAKPIIKSTVGLFMLIAALRTGLFAAGPDHREGLAPGAAISDVRVTRVPWEHAGRRWDVERIRQHDDPVIQQALIVLGQAVNPIRVSAPAQIREIYARRLGAGAPPAGLNAFRAPYDPHIYVNMDSGVYTSAVRTRSALAVLKLAATLLHEQVHNTDGEFAAYRMQSDFVRSRLRSLPWRQQEAARLYVQNLDVRANAFAPRNRGGRPDL
jgi:hypothetical protein